MKLTKKQQAEKLEAIARLRELLADGKIVINIKHVSRSGMMRHMCVYTSSLQNISHLVATAISWPLHEYNGVKVQGCGMDMTFHLAYVLTHELYTRDEIKSGLYNLTGNGGGILDWQNI